VLLVEGGTNTADPKEDGGEDDDDDEGGLLKVSVV